MQKRQLKIPGRGIQVEIYKEGGKTLSFEQTKNNTQT